MSPVIFCKEGKKCSNHCMWSPNFLHTTASPCMILGYSSSQTFKEGVWKSGVPLFMACKMKKARNWILTWFHASLEGSRKAQKGPEGSRRVQKGPEGSRKVPEGPRQAGMKRRLEFDLLFFPMRGGQYIWKKIFPARSNPPYASSGVTQE